MRIRTIISIEIERKRTGKRVKTELSDLQPGKVDFFKNIIANSSRFFVVFVTRLKSLPRRRVNIKQNVLSL